VLHESLRSLLAASSIGIFDPIRLRTCAKPASSHSPTRQADYCNCALGGRGGGHHSSSMHSRTAPIRPPTDMTAVDVAPLAPMFANGSAYVSLAALLLLLLRQVSVAPLLLVTVVVTLPM